MANYLGLDIGTSSIKAILLDCDLGKIISSASIKTPIRVINDTTAEHDPQDLVSAACKCIRQAVGDSPVDGLGISSFAEAGLPLDRKGQPLFPIIAWYDRRSQPQVDNFLRNFPETELIQITGQAPGFSFGLFKWLWIKAHHPDIARKTEFWLSTPDYLIYALTGKKRTDYTQASRTMMFDQRTLEWSEEILALASLNKVMLPEAIPSGAIAGEITPEAARLTGLPVGTPCSIGGHDHLCGAFASGGYDPTTLIDSSGSSQAIIALQEEYDPRGAWFEKGYVHYHHVLPDTYLIKGGLKAAGKVFEWLKYLLQLDPLPSESEMIEKRLRNEIELPIMMPFFIGSGTPDRAPFQQGALIDLNLEHTPQHLLMSFYEGMGFWLRDNIETLERLTQQKYQGIIAIGGTNQNPDLQQIKSQITQKFLIIPTVPQASATGAALLAAVGCGTYSNHQSAQQSLNYPAHHIYPDPSFKDRYDEIFYKRYLPTKKALLSAR